MSGSGDQNGEGGPKEKKVKLEDMHDVLHRLKDQNQKQIHSITKSIDQLIADKERVERVLEQVRNESSVVVDGENGQRCIIRFPDDL